MKAKKTTAKIKNAMEAMTATKAATAMETKSAPTGTVSISKLKAAATNSLKLKKKQLQEELSHDGMTKTRGSFLIFRKVNVMETNSTPTPPTPANTRNTHDGRHLK